jgi:hypothetical protein
MRNAEEDRNTKRQRDRETERQRDRETENNSRSGHVAFGHGLSMVARFANGVKCWEMAFRTAFDQSLVPFCADHSPKAAAGSWMVAPACIAVSTEGRYQ